MIGSRRDWFMIGWSKVSAYGAGIVRGLSVEGNDEVEWSLEVIWVLLVDDRYAGHATIMTLMKILRTIFLVMLTQC